MTRKRAKRAAPRKAKARGKVAIKRKGGPSKAPRRSAKPSARPKSDAAARTNVATTAQMAKLFACTERQVQLLAEQGIAVRVGHGTYDFAQSTINYVTHLRDQAAGRAGLDPQSDTATANAERSREQTLLARTKRLALEGQLIEVAKALEVWTRILRGLRQGVLGLPNSIAHEVPTLSGRDIAAIKRLCTDMLQDMAAGKGFALTGIDTEETGDDAFSGEAGAADAGGAEAAAADPAE